MTIQHRFFCFISLFLLILGLPSPAFADHYYDNAIRKNPVCHKTPRIHVYFQPSPHVKYWTGEHMTIAKNAVRAWRSALNKRLSFKQVPTAKEAHIVVKWQELYKNSDGSYSAGNTKSKRKGTTLYDARVTLTTIHPKTGKPYGAYDLRSTATHEMGHAIGVKGHSPNKTDLMYKDPVKGRSQIPTSRDVKTMHMIYDRCKQ